MGRYYCEPCGDDFSKPGTCEIHGEPLIKIDDEEQEVEMFDEEEY